MKNLITALGLAFALAACGGGSGIEKEMNTWKDKMCACKDKACTEKTMDEYRAWTKGKRDEAKKMSKDQLDKLEKIEDELKACRRKYRDADEGAAPPAGEPAAPAAGGETPPPATP